MYCSSITHSSLLTKKQCSSTQMNKLFCSMQYSSMAHKIKHVITKNWSILSSDPSLGPLFTEPPLFTFKHPPTLVRSYSQYTNFKSPMAHSGVEHVHCAHINKISMQDSCLAKTFHCCFANCNSTFSL